MSDAKVELIDAATLGRMIDTHPVTLYRWCRAGRFPKPFYVGQRRMWRLAEIKAWIAEQAGRDQISDSKGE